MRSFLIASHTQETRCTLLSDGITSHRITSHQRSVLHIGSHPIIYIPSSRFIVIHIESFVITPFHCNILSVVSSTNLAP
jgi:hypothetical protein